MKNINITLGQRIKLCRNNINMTRETLAEKIDVSTRFLADVEAGKVGVSIKSLKKLCMVLNVSADYLLGMSQLEVRNTPLSYRRSEQDDIEFEDLIEEFSSIDKKYYTVLAPLISTLNQKK